MRRFIYTADIGGLWYGRETLPTMQRYAESVGAELVVIDHCERANPQHVLLDVFMMAAQAGDGDLHLWLDLDICCKPGAADVFDRAGACMWAAQDYKVGPRIFRNWAPKYGLDDFRPYFNTGVVLFDTGHARKLVAAGAVRTDWEPRGNGHSLGDQEPFGLLWRWAGIGVRYFPKQVVCAPREMRGFVPDFVHFLGKRKRRKLRVAREKAKRVGVIL